MPPARSPSARARTSSSTRWTSSASAASPSRRSRSASHYTQRRRAGLRHEPHRHARPRRLRLRGLARARRLRGGAAGRRRRAGRRGADAGQRLPGARQRPGDRAGAQQDRSAVGRSRRHQEADRGRHRHGRLGRAAGVGQDRASASTRSSRPSRRASRRPRAIPAAPLQALIFDSWYDTYKGVVTLVRVVNGTLQQGHQDPPHRHAEGLRGPRRRRVFAAPDGAGVAVGGRGRLRHRQHQEVADTKIGDTITETERPAPALPGFKVVKPMVFAGIFPTDSARYVELREALEKLALNDSSFTYEAETLAGARLRLSLRLPRPAAHGDRAGAPRARVQPRPHRHRADGALPHRARRRARSPRSTTRRRCPIRASSTTSRSRSSPPRCTCRTSTSAT